MLLIWLSQNLVLTALLCIIPGKSFVLVSFFFDHLNSSVCSLNVFPGPYNVNMYLFSSDIMKYLSHWADYILFFPSQNDANFLNTLHEVYLQVLTKDTDSIKL